MIFKIISYDKVNLIHTATDEKGNRRRIDFMVDGTLDKRYKKPESLIGKMVECERVHPYQEIAHEVKILK